MEGKIIKKQKIRYRKGVIAWEEGELILYPQKLVFFGSKKITIPLNEIENISVNDGFGQGNIIISTEEAEYKFFKNNSSMNTTALLFGMNVAAMGDKKISDLEAWRQSIEKLRENGNNLTDSSNSLQLLKERLAKGEISLEEYHSLKKVIE